MVNGRRHKGENYKPERQSDSGIKQVLLIREYEAVNSRRLRDSISITIGVSS